MLRSHSLHAIYYAVDLLDTITDHIYIIIPLQNQTICLPDCCPPQSISTLPATRLECSDANASGFLVFSFQSLKNDAGTGGVVPILGESLPP